MALAFELPTSNPPLPTGETSRNQKYDVMFDSFRRDGTDLGNITYRSRPTNWRLILPVGQYVPEEDTDSFHYMATYHGGKFNNVADLTASELEPIADTMLTFTDEIPRARSGYNIGPDLTRRTSQSWHNLHVHFVNQPAPEAYRPLVGVEPRKLREFGWPIIDDATRWWFGKNASEFAGVTSIDTVKWGIANRYPKGGASLVLSDTITPRQLAQTFKGVDKVYNGLHREVFSRFTANYDVASQSRGEVPYVLRDPQDIRRRVSGFYPQEEGADSIRNTMRLLAGRFRPATAEIHSSRRIITPPAYTAILLQAELEGKRKKILTVAPHLFSEGGTLEAEGVLLMRSFKEDFSLQERTRRATEAVRRLHGHA